MATKKKQLSPRRRKRQNLNLNYALEYAKKGWSVFPLHTAKYGKCSCKKTNCENIGKHPQYHKDFLPHGLKQASRDEGVIKQWWKLLWPNANIGLRLDDNIFAIDEDPRNGGDKTRQDLEKNLGEFTFKAVIQKTGGGGHHYLYRSKDSYKVKSKQGALGPGLDIKAQGGYIVAFPSIHESGLSYSWVKGNIPTLESISLCPEFLLNRIQDSDHPKRKTELTDDVIQTGVKEGDRNEALFELAKEHRWLVNKGIITPKALEAIVLEFARNCKPPLSEREALRTLDSVLSYTKDELKVANFQIQESGTTLFLVKDKADVHTFKPILQEGEEATVWIEDPSKLSSIHKKRLRDRAVVIFPPDDMDNIKKAQSIGKKITKYSKGVRVTEPPPGQDVITLSDWVNLNFPEGMDNIPVSNDPVDDINVPKPSEKILFRQFIDRMISEAIEMKWLPGVFNKYIRTLEEHRKIKTFPKRKRIMNWLKESDYGYFYGHDGTGKTTVIWEIARGLTHGGPVMDGRWQVDDPIKVLIIDSELPPADIQSKSEMMGIDKSHIISKQELLSDGVWPPLNLADETTQRLIYETARRGKFKAVLVDNITTMTDGIDPDKEKDWRIINDFFLSLRTLGVIIIFVCHAGKDGKDRGTSARRDAVDWSIGLLAKGKSEKHRGKGVGGEDPLVFRMIIGKKRGMMPFVTGYVVTYLDGDFTAKDGITIDDDPDKVDMEKALLMERDYKILCELIKGTGYREIVSMFDKSPFKISQGGINALKKKYLKEKAIVLDDGGKVLEGEELKTIFDDFYSTEK